MPGLSLKRLEPPKWYAMMFSIAFSRFKYTVGGVVARNAYSVKLSLFRGLAAARSEEVLNALRKMYEDGL